jgi:hypothetical protein
MKDEIPLAPKLIPGTYQHYKGNLYQVVGLACHSESLQWHVIYKPLYEHKNMPDLWVRPYAMFVENIEVDGQTVPRFKLVDKP